MPLHIVHFTGPINATTACTVRNLCLQALQSGAGEIDGALVELIDVRAKLASPPPFT
jgi:hypothetical protein